MHSQSREVRERGIILKMAVDQERGFGGFFLPMGLGDTEVLCAEGCPSYYSC